MGLTMPLPEMSGAEPVGRVMISNQTRQHASGVQDRIQVPREGGLTVDGLVDTVAAVLSVGDAAATGARQQTYAAENDASLVTDDIAEQVARDDDTVEVGGVLDQHHGGRVAGEGQVGGQARDALDLGAAVRLRVAGQAVAVVRSLS